MSSLQRTNENHLPMIHVVHHDQPSSPRVKYGIEWKLPIENHSKVDSTPLAVPIEMSIDFDQGDSSTQTISVRDLIEKFENKKKTITNKKQYRIMAGLCSMFFFL